MTRKEKESENDKWVRERNRQEPVKETVRDGMGGDKETLREHPAFGLISASRFTSGGGGYQLFGSPIRHYEGITIKITTAKEYYDLHRSWIHPEEQIIEVTVSEAQWAAFVSHLNVGSGIPCTINYYQQGPFVSMPAITEENWTQKRARDIKEKVEHDLTRLREAVAKLDEVLKKPSVRKSDLAEVRHLLLKAVDHAPGHYQFIADSVTEHTVDLVNAAKAEVVAMVTRLSMQYPALTNSAPELPQLEKPEDVA